MESELRFTDPGHTRTVDFPASLAVDLATVQRRLQAGNGGYEIVHASPGLEVGVYVLVAPEPDRQQPHADDELYYVLEGRGVLEVEGKPVPLEQARQCLSRPARCISSLPMRA